MKCWPFPCAMGPLGQLPPVNQLACRRSSSISEVSVGLCFWHGHSVAVPARLSSGDGRSGSPPLPPRPFWSCALVRTLGWSITMTDMDGPTCFVCLVLLCLFCSRGSLLGIHMRWQDLHTSLPLLNVHPYTSASLSIFFQSASFRMAKPFLYMNLYILIFRQFYFHSKWRTRCFSQSNAHWGDVPSLFEGILRIAPYIWLGPLFRASVKHNLTLSSFIS